MVDAGSPAEAVRLALTGAVDVFLPGRAATAAFGMATAGVSAADQTPFRVAVAGEAGTVRLEDLAGRPDADWDYNDRSWRVSVRQHPATAFGPVLGTAELAGEGAPELAPAVSASSIPTFYLTNSNGQRATVTLQVTEPSAGVMKWEYTVTNESVTLPPPLRWDNDIGGSFGLAVADPGEVTNPDTDQPWSWRNPWPGVGVGWRGESVGHARAGTTAAGPGPGSPGASTTLPPGATGRFSFETPARSLVWQQAQLGAGVGPRYVHGAAGEVLGPGPLSIELLKPNAAGALVALGHANVSKWSSAFSFANPPPGIVADKNFHKTDADRFYAKIIDPGQAGKGKVTAAIRTNDIAGDEADRVVDFELTEAPAGSGVFYSEAFVLVSNKVDDLFQAANAADGTPKDPSLNIFKPSKMTSNPLGILVGGEVEVRYDPKTGAAPADMNKGAKAVAPIGHDIKTVSIRPVILRDKAQVDGGQPVVPTSEVNETMALINVAWAQANMRFVPTGVPIVRDPPAGVTLNDGVNEVGDPTPSPEMRALINGVSDSDPKTIDAIFINRFSSNYRGMNYNPSRVGNSLPVPNEIVLPNYMPNNLAKPLVGIDDGGTPRDFAVPGHEVGHIVMDTGHYGLLTAQDAVNLMQAAVSETDKVDATATKRLTAAQVQVARGFAG